MQGGVEPLSGEALHDRPEPRVVNGEPYDAFRLSAHPTHFIERRDEDSRTTAAAHRRLGSTAVDADDPRSSPTDGTGSAPKLGRLRPNRSPEPPPWRRSANPAGQAGARNRTHNHRATPDPRWLSSIGAKTGRVLAKHHVALIRLAHESVNDPVRGFIAVNANDREYDTTKNGQNGERHTKAPQRHSQAPSCHRCSPGCQDRSRAALKIASRE